MRAARRRDRDPHPRARRDRPAARHRARGHRRRRGQHRHRPDRAGGLPGAEGDRARQRPAEPGALRPPRDHPDRVRDVGPPRPRRARGARARPRRLLELRREGLEVVEVQVVARGSGRRQARRRARAARRASRLVSVMRNGVAEIAAARHGDPAGRPGDRDPQARCSRTSCARAPRRLQLQTRQ